MHGVGGEHTHTYTQLNREIFLRKLKKKRNWHKLYSEKAPSEACYSEGCLYTVTLLDFFGAWGE
jgi:hypothetical protein